MSVALNTLLIRNDDILHALIGSDEAVMMCVKSGMYYGLNSVASRVWEFLESPKAVFQICAQISREFEVDPKTCERDVLEFVKVLLANGIVKITAQ